MTSAAMISRFTGQLIDEETHIKQSIADIITTPIGSRLFRRNYGSRLPEFIDGPLSPQQMMQLRASVLKSIKAFEPRVKITKITTTVNNNGGYSLDLTFIRTDLPNAAAQTITIGV